MKAIQLLLVFLIIYGATSQATRAGTRTVTYAANHAFRNNTATARSISYNLNFPAAFPSVPQVALVLAGIDVDYRAAGVSLEVTSVTRTNFTYQIRVPAGARLSAVKLYWLATVSTSINVGYFKQTNPQVADIGVPTISGSVTFSRSLSGQVNAVPFISGFYFRNNSAARLTAEVNGLSPNSASLDIFVNANNRPSYVNIAVIHYRTTAGGQLNFQTTLNGPLAQGSGPRSQIVTRSLPRKSYFLFYGISSFNFVGARNYRLFESVTATNTTNATNINANFSTDGNTRIIQAAGNVFYI